MAGEEALAASQLECNQLATLIRVRPVCLTSINSLLQHSTTVSIFGSGTNISLIVPLKVQEIDGSMAQLTSALAARTVERDRVNLKFYHLRISLHLKWIKVNQLRSLSETIIGQIWPFLVQ